MKLHEFQAKELFRQYGIPVQSGVVIERPEQLGDLSLRYPLVLKAQVLVGGRGKAGGIKLAQTPAEAKDRAAAILGMSIKGEVVHRLLVASSVQIAAEYYLAFIVDRAARALTAIASAAGGMEIEEIARHTPEKIARMTVDPVIGFRPFHARALGRRIGLQGPLLKEFASTATGLARLCREGDAELAEINPLGVVDGHFLAVDAKVIIDDNAVFRHKDLPPNEELTDLEAAAKRAGLSYVELDGDIAIIGNGAGLVMSTLDMVAHFGGAPANFLDVGGGASEDNMRQAIGIVTRKPGLRVLFVNIFGGITRCDDIARAIVATPVSLPMVVRLTGTNEDEGRTILKSAGIDAFIDPEGAARRVIALAAERADSRGATR